MTLTVSERLSREFKALRQVRRAARGWIDTTQSEPITHGFRKTTKETILDICDEITGLKSAGISFPDITKAFNSRYGSAIKPTTFEIYYKQALSKRRNAPNGN